MLPFEVIIVILSIFFAKNGTQIREEKTADFTLTKSEKSSNKLRMKALEGWNTFYQHSKLNNFDRFLNQDKNCFEIGTPWKFRSINNLVTIPCIGL